jgi:hypothetical protein
MVRPGEKGIIEVNLDVWDAGLHAIKQAVPAKSPRQVEPSAHLQVALGEKSPSRKEYWPLVSVLCLLA